MQHFVDVLQMHLTNQIHFTYWKDFKTQFVQAQGMENMKKVHEEYVNKAIDACLLSERKKPVLGIVMNIFAIILKFHLQVISATTTGYVDYQQLSNHVEETNLAFDKSTRFLFMILTKRNSKMQDEHLSLLLLHWNFNGFYGEQGL